MSEIQAALGLADPASIAPDASDDLTLQYANRNHDISHRLRTITTSPTWDLSQQQTHQIEQTVPARTKQRVLTTPLETPPALGGRHGIDVTFKVTAGTEGNDGFSERRRSTEPMTVPVTGARQYQAVVCAAGDRELSPAVRRVIQQWGFDIYLADNVRTVKARITEYDDDPTMLVGVVPSNGDDNQGRQLVSSAAWAVADTTTLSIVLAEEGTSLPALPTETAVFASNLASQRELLRATGPELLTMRQSLQTGQSSRLLEVLQKGVTVAKQEPKEFLRALSYSTLLEATDTPQAVLNLIEVPEDLLTSSQSESARVQWPMFGATPQNTGHHPNQQGPKRNLTERWSFKTGNTITSAPTVANDVIYFGGFDGNLYAVDRNTGKKSWKFEAGASIGTSPAVVGGSVFVGSSDKNVYALDAATGRERWKFKTDGPFWSSPAVADGTVYIGNHDSNVYALDTATGRERWKFETDSKIWSSPAVADETVYVGSDDNNVYALDTKTGRERWKFETEYSVWSSPAVANGTIYVGSDDNNVYALDVATGRERWKFETGNQVDRSPAVANRTIYVGSNDSNVYALDAATGRERWKFETGATVYSSPTVVDGSVYVGSNDSNVYALGAASGRERWKFKTGGGVQCSPAVVDGTVYVGSSDNRIYALTES